MCILWDIFALCTCSLINKKRQNSKQASLPPKKSCFYVLRTEKLCDLTTNP